MNDEKNSDQCYNELTKQVKSLFIDIQFQNNLKERLQKDSYRYIDIYGQLTEYHETVSSLIHSVSRNLVKAGSVEQVQRTSDEDLEKLHSEAVALRTAIMQARDDTQQDIKRASSFIDYYSYEPSHINSCDFSSLTSSVNELINLEKERFDLENQLYNKTKCQTEIYACDIIASIDKVINK